MLTNIPNLPNLPLDFSALIEEVLSATRSNTVQQADALRSVIERHNLSDYDGVRLFSAIMTVVRESALAA